MRNPNPVVFFPLAYGIIALIGSLIGLIFSNLDVVIFYIFSFLFFFLGRADSFSDLESVHLFLCPGWGFCKVLTLLCGVWSLD